MISARLGLFLEPVLHNGNHDGGNGKKYSNRAENDHSDAWGSSGGQVVANRAESLNSGIEVESVRFERRMSAPKVGRPGICSEVTVQVWRVEARKQVTAVGPGNVRDIARRDLWGISRWCVARGARFVAFSVIPAVRVTEALLSATQ